MKFQPILKRWCAAGRDVHAQNAETALATFASGHPQVSDNLAHDGEISQSHREELLEQWLLVDPAHADSVKSKYLGYCRSHQCIGRQNPTAQRATLGHVEERRKTEGCLASTALGRSPLTRSHRSSPRFILDRLLRHDLPGQQSLLFGIYLSRWIMWSFYVPSRLVDPFESPGRLRSELVRRLGLGRTGPNEELLLWEIRLESHQPARRPTTFDAEDYEFFRPGGKTHPLSGTGGLHEVVHPPILGDQLVARIEVAS